MKILKYIISKVCSPASPIPVFHASQMSDFKIEK